MASQPPPKEPKVFVTPGRPMPPVDTQLVVFGQRFHIHSSILRIHSEYFRTFIESADKANSTLSGPMKYEWVTEVDQHDRREWSLVGVTYDAARGRNIREETFIGVKAIDEQNFEKLLAAIYSRPYQIISFADLESLAKLADFYRVQPVVSRSLLASFSPTFGRCINQFAKELLPISIQLRHALLFRECLTQLMGPWSHPRYLTISDNDLRNRIRGVAERTYHKITAKVATAHQDLLELFLSMPHRPMYPPGWGQGIVQASLYAANWSMVGNQIWMPLYFRHLNNYQGPGGDDVRRVLGHLLRSSLKLEYYQQIGAGEQGPHRDYRDYFLCTEIANEDLPWDTTQLEW